MSRIERMTDVQLISFRKEPRICSKCGFAGTVGDFGMAKCHGHLIVRKWCAGCLKAYYREYAKRRRGIQSNDPKRGS